MWFKRRKKKSNNYNYYYDDQLHIKNVTDLSEAYELYIDYPYMWIVEDGDPSTLENITCKHTRNGYVYLVKGNMINKMFKLYGSQKFDNRLTLLIIPQCNGTSSANFGTWIEDMIAETRVDPFSKLYSDDFR